MNPHDFVAQLDEARIIHAIQEAERKTSGEIRLFVSRRDLGTEDILARARARFVKMGMTATRERNAILLYFIPRNQRFAIIGDKGIHEKCGSDFWEAIAADMRTHLLAGRCTDAIVAGIESAGDELARYFPRDPDDRDELADAIASD